MTTMFVSVLQPSSRSMRSRCIRKYRDRDKYAVSICVQDTPAGIMTSEKILLPTAYVVLRVRFVACR